MAHNESTKHFREGCSFVPYKQCPQCASWAYSASQLPKWECPECETDISDVPTRDTPPPGVYEQFKKMAETVWNKDVVMNLKRIPKT